MYQCAARLLFCGDRRSGGRPVSRCKPHNRTLTFGPAHHWGVCRRDRCRPAWASGAHRCTPKGRDRGIPALLASGLATHTGMRMEYGAGIRCRATPGPGSRLYTVNTTRGQVVTIRWRLVLASALMLFLELALIRWLGANVVHLSYFSNFVLLGSFLGIGLGFLISRRSWSVLPAAPVILAVLVLFTFLAPVTLDRAGDQIIYFTSLTTSGPPAWLVLPLIFILVAAVLAGPSEVVGRCFAHLRPLTAYRWDLVGSLIGIASFTLLSFLRAPSVVWGIVVTICFVVLIGGWRRYLAAVAGLAMVAALLVETLSPGISWSPYYKIHTEDSV